ncbi:hypothetical protein [Haloarchaeobius sp. HRN-SO-5]|uniref:hypothetical protein n=1 Tax=Haloarchaeobius sp. HRN-SO-5 TaxID=3446118 RepID=UPI003EBBA5BD
MTDSSNDTTTTDRTDDATTTTAARGSDARDRTTDENGERGPRRTVLWVALVGLGLFSLVMLFQFYASAMQTIGDWIGPAYRSLVRTGFSLVLLCLSLLGVAYVTRELTE